MSEYCPFCKTQINDGAIICIGCGSRKEYKGPNGSPGFSLLLILSGAFFTFAVGKGVEGMGIPMMIVGGIFLFFNYRGFKELVWRRRY